MHRDDVVLLGYSGKVKGRCEHVKIPIHFERMIICSQFDETCFSGLCHIMNFSSLYIQKFVFSTLRFVFFCLCVPSLKLAVYT